jgi:hypothetical protein
VSKPPLLHSHLRTACIGSVCVSRNSALTLACSRSLGWVAYATAAVVSAIGENKLMPPPDCPCKVINGRSGYVRDNSSWIIGRIVRDYDNWRDNGRDTGPIQARLDEIINEQWAKNRADAEHTVTGSGANEPRPSQAGLCVSIYRAGEAKPGYPGYDLVYFIGFATLLLQLGVAAIPCGLFGDWAILLVTVCGILLSFLSGCLSQWSKEKWSCRLNSSKTVVLTKGNGSQHAIVIIGEGRGLDLEDLASGPTNVNTSTSYMTRFAVVYLALFWILLLITAAGIKQNTWFLLAVGTIGIVQNIFVAGRWRYPRNFGVPLTFTDVIGDRKVMQALFKVEKQYPRLGRSMLDTFFPGKLRPHEEELWKELGDIADALDASQN